MSSCPGRAARRVRIDHLSRRFRPRIAADDANLAALYLRISCASSHVPAAGADIRRGVFGLEFGDIWRVIKWITFLWG
jgi:hypothetical protein